MGVELRAGRAGAALVYIQDDVGEDTRLEVLRLLCALSLGNAEQVHAGLDFLFSHSVVSAALVHSLAIEVMRLPPSELAFLCLQTALQSLLTTNDIGLTCT